MKKEIIMIAAALALAGCNRDNGTGATGNASDTDTGYNSSVTISNRTSGRMLGTNSNSGGLGNSSVTNSGTSFNVTSNGVTINRSTDSSTAPATTSPK